MSDCLCRFYIYIYIYSTIYNTIYNMYTINSESIGIIFIHMKYICDIECIKIRLANNVKIYLFKNMYAKNINLVGK